MLTPPAQTKTPLVLELPEVNQLIDTVRCCAIDAGYIEFPNELESLAFFANDLCSTMLLYGSLEPSEFYQNALIVSELYGPLLTKGIETLFTSIDNVVRALSLPGYKPIIEDMDILPSSGYVVLVFSNMNKGAQ